MKTLITGGAGFIGSHLVTALVERGDDVVVLDSYESQVHGETQAEASSTNGVVELRGDVADPRAAARALEGADRVVHLAAVVGVGQSMYEIERYVQKNTMATASFLQQIVSAERRPRRLVVASSMSIYGEGEYVCPTDGTVAPPPRTDTQLDAKRWELECALCGAPLEPIATRESKPLQPTSVYAVTKRDHEELCLIAGRAYGIPTAALRFFNVYGPGQALSNPYTGVAAIFAARLLNRNSPVIFEDGRQSRDFVHVSDIVRGILLALEEDAAADVTLNLGTGRPTTVNDVAEALGGALGIEAEPQRTEQYRSGDIRHCYADITQARAVLGFEAQVSFQDGMRDLAGWLADQEATDRIDEATQELVNRGLAR